MLMKSESTYVKLTNLLTITIAIFCGHLILSFVEEFVPQKSTLFEVIYILISTGAVVMVILETVFYCIWLYKFHTDLKTIYPGYQISGGGALARFLIPIYNVWGFWNIHSTYADKLKSTAGYYDLGTKLHSLTPILYALVMVSRVLGRMVLKGSFTEHLSRTNIFTIEIISSIIDISLFIILLSVLKIMHQSLFSLIHTKIDENTNIVEPPASIT